MTSCIALVLAAGRGTRLGAALPKQYLPLAGEPLLTAGSIAAGTAGAAVLGVWVLRRGFDFNAAIQLRPNYAEAVFQLATLDFDHAQLVAARTRIDGYISTYSATADLLLLGVRVARAQGDVLAAQRYGRRLQLDYPGSDQARALSALGHNPG